MIAVSSFFSWAEAAPDASTKDIRKVTEKSVRTNLTSGRCDRTSSCRSARSLNAEISKGAPGLVRTRRSGGNTATVLK